MNYKIVYEKLIEKGKNRLFLDGYVERHHIIPKSFGGSNDKSNIVALTAREHFIAHLLLAKIYGGKMSHAVWRMIDRAKSGRIYEMLKLQKSKLMKELKPGRFNKGVKKKPITDSHRKALSESKKGFVLSDYSIKKRNDNRKKSAEKRGFWASEETKKKMSMSQKKRLPPSKEQRLQISETVKSTWYECHKAPSEETKAKTRESIRAFYDSPKGIETKRKISEIRRKRNEQRIIKDTAS